MTIITVPDHWAWTTDIDLCHGVVVAMLATVKVSPWAMPGTEAAIEAFTGGPAELEPAPGARA